MHGVRIAHNMYTFVCLHTGVEDSREGIQKSPSNLGSWILDMVMQKLHTVRRNLTLVLRGELLGPRFLSKIPQQSWILDLASRFLSTGICVTDLVPVFRFYGETFKEMNSLEAEVLRCDSAVMISGGKLTRSFTTIGMGKLQC